MNTMKSWTLFCLSIGVIASLSTACTPIRKVSSPDTALTNHADSSGSVEATVQEALQAAADNEALNAFIHLAEAEVLLEQAREADARRANGTLKGPLDGVLLVVKDNIHVAGMPNSAGTPALAEFRPQEDAPVIARLREAGAIILGKTNMHELAFGISSYNSAFHGDQIGVRNAYDSERMAGGSSGGTAAAIGAGVVKGGLGTDTGGSSRIPAALNNIVGFRPTVGRYSGDGITPISHTRDTAGPMAADVRSVALLDAVMSGKMVIPTPAKADGLRLGISDTFLANMEPEVERLWNQSLAALEEAGITLVKVDASQLIELNNRVGFPVAMYEAGVDMRAYLEKYDVGLDIETLAEGIASPDVAATYADLVIPGKLGGPDGLVDAAPIYEAAIATHRPLLIAEYERLFADHALDALLFPTTPAVAKLADEESSSLDNFVLFIQNTDAAGNAGLPGLSVPMGLTVDGLPAGLEIDGLPGSDAEILSIGLTLETVLQASAD